MHKQFDLWCISILTNLVKYGILHCPIIVIALDEQYKNYAYGKFVK